MCDPKNKIENLLEELTSSLDRYCLDVKGRGIDKGVCDTACFELKQMLHIKGVQSEIKSLPGHCVLSTFLDSQQYVIDPTLGQYIEIYKKKIWFGRYSSYLKTLKKNKVSLYYKILLKNKLFEIKNNKK